MHIHRHNVVSRSPALLMCNITLHVWHGNMTITLIQLAIELGVPINHAYKYYTVLERVVDTHNLKLVSLLINAGANVNIDNGFPLRRACQLDDIDMFDLLVSAGADVNRNSHVSVVILYYSVRMLSKLLSAGAVMPENALKIARESRVDPVEKQLLIKEYNQLILDQYNNQKYPKIT